MAKALPFPRLELRWRKTRKDEGYSSNTVACEYVMVLFPANIGDIRCNSNTKAAAKPVEYILSTTYRHSDGEMPHPSDIPYRDGAHAMWDATALNIPIYGRSGRKTIRININESVPARVAEKLAS